MIKQIYNVLLVSLFSIFMRISAQNFYTNGIFKLTWYNSASTTHFVFETTISTMDNYYTAFAFSKDTRMGDDDVIICKIQGAKRVLERYYNTGHSTPLYSFSDNPSIGLSNINIVITNGLLKCEFDRDKAIFGSSKLFDINTNYNILFAQGNLNSADGLLNEHNERVSSSKTFDFINSPSFSTMNTISTTTKIQTTLTTNVQTSVTTATKVLTTTLLKTTEKTATPIKENYFYLGIYSKDDYKLLWNNTNNKTDFVYETKVSWTNNFYTAFGFSNDRSMGDDDVVICFYSSSLTKVERNYNQKRSSSLMNQAQPSIGLSNVKVSLTNGILRCEFTREKYLPSEKNNFDLDKQYYLLFAKGTSSVARSSINEHSDKESSKQKINFLQNSENVGFRIKHSLLNYSLLFIFKIIILYLF